MDASGRADSNRAYYDAFSKNYERQRGRNAPNGYHELLDELESDLVRRYGAGGDLLDVGCGTGLVLERVAQFARSAQGVDLSPGMLKLARDRGLDVREGSALELPFSDHQFDVSYSFKVLAHVREIEKALAEMARVTKPGGHILAEFYNPHSFRGWIKRLGPKLKIAEQANEGDVFTRFDSPEDAERLTPKGCRMIDARGLRIVTAAGAMMKVPGLRQLLRQSELILCDSGMKKFAGFFIAVYAKAP